MKYGNSLIPHEQTGTAEHFGAPGRAGGRLRQIVKILPIPSSRTLGHFCSCLFFLVLLPAIVPAQSAENDTKATTVAGSSASAIPGDPAVLQHGMHVVAFGAAEEGLRVSGLPLRMESD